MWISDNKLNKIEETLKFNLQYKQKILISYYYVNNNYYDLLSDSAVIETIKHLIELKLKDIADLIYFFYNEIDILGGWNNLRLEFKNKYPNIYDTITFLQKNIIKIPIHTNTNYNINNVLI